MKYSCSILALVCSASLANAETFKVEQIDKIDALPCSAFFDRGQVGSLREGVSLAVPISATNNVELFKRLADRMNYCKNEADARSAH